MNSIPIIHNRTVSKGLLMTNIAVALVYIAWWLNLGHIGNPLLYGLLFFGEIYHLCMSLFFWYTIWPRKPEDIKQGNQFTPTVDVFIPTAGEPMNVVRNTVNAVKSMDYPHKNIYILNDGYVAKKQNWKDMEILAKETGTHCITRMKAGGAKAGNINNALQQTSGEIVVIFDADMAPHSDFLKKMIPPLIDPKVGFVQSPQYYNNALTNGVTAAAWEQQEFFFGPIMQGKNTVQSAFICGTNVAIRRTALEQAGGMFEKNIAEDFLTSLFIHQKNWKSYYIPEVLAEGMAPTDLLAYYKQQLRWARGSLEVLFGYNPLFKRGLTWGQKTQYLASALYYFNGLIILIDIIIPLFFLYFGMVAVSATTTSFAFFFIPYIFLNLYTIYLVSDRSLTFRAISFSQSSFVLQLQALFAVLTKKQSAFVVTPKQAQHGNFIYLAAPHILYAVISFIGIYLAITREGLSPAVSTNAAWTLFNIALFYPFIREGVKIQQFSQPSQYSTV